MLMTKAGRRDKTRDSGFVVSLALVKGRLILGDADLALTAKMGGASQWFDGAGLLGSFCGPACLTFICGFTQDGPIDSATKCPLELSQNPRSPKIRYVRPILREFVCP